ncbi:ATP-dependent DNA helicase II subunit 1 [Penicillium ucsense]|uniref:ATP-dependent DNA helicase II subunit 1 n=1 Tax=Penicillium ucsense TaxID=2839758 RepID=A0A8J8VX61_9EURO|nr:ATP-dependent DNA helicase II subunit 1 [Penicillium ucsense]KAF7737378.1 ATP-dependent DNA helicase II subunit 1 [Penicillium ucsense]
MADDNFTRDDDVAEEEEEVDETVKSFRAVKDAVLFAIDVSSSMLEPRLSEDSRRPVQESPTSAALKCAYYLMQQRIISNPRDMMGVLLYGTESTKFYDEDGNTGSDLSYPHCYLFTDLDIPSAQEVKNLRALAGNEESARGILRPSSERVSMANVLFCANQIFTTKAPNFLSRRLFIVTDDDNPHQDNKSLRSAATVRARDLYDLSVNIELFPISRPDHEFDTSKFYDDIIYKPSPRDGEAPTYLQPDTKTSTGKGDGISLLNSLLSSINSRAVPRRSLFSNVPLEIGPNFKIAVNGYLLLKKQEPARSCYVWLGGEKPRIVKGITTHMADDTAQTVEKSEIRKAYKFGGEQVTFTPEELQALRNFGDPVIRIIGFKPLSALPIWANVKHPSFIYPSEDDFVGSTRVFSALHQKLLKDQKIAIVWFIPRKNSAPVVAAMIAGEERLDENGVQKVPPGMWLIPLPFADDVRENPPAVLSVSPDDLTDAMRQVIGQLQLPRGTYDAQKYPNPALQWHYRILQALALDEDYPGEPEDKTKPRYRQIDKRAGDYVLEWSRLLDMIFDKMYGGQAATTSTLVKREARDAGEGASRPPAKRVKTEEPADLEEQVRQCYERGTLKKLTLHVLKSFLNAHGRATAGKKDDLIDQVEQYFERKN